MRILAASVNHRTATVALRERLALPKDRQAQAVRSLADRFGGEALLLSTCNRSELYLSKPLDQAGPGLAEETVHALADLHQLPAEDLRPALSVLEGPDAVRHLFRVAASLDSIVVGEAQIAGQVREAYELAAEAGAAGTVFHLLFQQARQVAKRIRNETGLTSGKVSVSSLAIDYLREVFDRFDNKTILVLGAGKIGQLTLQQLIALKPNAVLVANRSAEKAALLAAECGGSCLPWEQLDTGLARADIILSATGAAEPIVTAARFRRLLPRRGGRPVAILDLAVPRDFDPAVAALEEVDLLVNVDDLKAIQEKALETRLRHVPAAEAIVAAETERFFKEWSRRWTGPAIARLGQEWDAIRQEVERECLGRLNGKLSEADKATIAGALRLLQNKLLHTPIVVLQEEAKAGRAKGLVEAVMKLFRLGD